MTQYADLQGAASSLVARTPEEVREAEDRILRFISSATWTFAKTMPHVPHEYCVLKRTPELQEEFVWFARYILSYGKVERWGTYKHSYYYFRNHKYWTMDGVVEETNLINRESTTDVPCRLDATCEH